MKSCLHRFLLFSFLFACGSCWALVRPTLYNATPFITDVVVKFRRQQKKTLSYRMLPGSAVVIERDTYVDFYGEPGNPSPIDSIIATVQPKQEVILGKDGKPVMTKVVQRGKTVVRADVEPGKPNTNFEKAYLDSIEKKGNFAIISTGAVNIFGASPAEAEQDIADLKIVRFIQ